MKKYILTIMALCLMAITPAGVQAFEMMNNIKSVGNVGSKVINVYRGYDDAKNNIDDGANVALKEGAVTAGTVTYGVASAAASGAGSLTGYAGMASTVSSLGMGSVTTSIAGAMGSSASGAAATAVVTSAVGGPLVMGAIIIVGSTGVAYGIYKGGQAIYKWVSD